LNGYWRKPERFRPVQSAVWLLDSFKICQADPVHRRVAADLMNANN
jgi:hypothetical protein